MGWKLTIMSVKINAFTRIWWGNTKEINHLEELSLEGRIILGRM
jgi:hypothetical protein